MKIGQSTVNLDEGLTRQLTNNLISKLKKKLFLHHKWWVIEIDLIQNWVKKNVNKT